MSFILTPKQTINNVGEGSELVIISDPTLKA